MSDLQRDTARMMAELGLSTDGAGAAAAPKKQKAPKQAPPKALVVPALSGNINKNSAIPTRLQKAMDKKLGKVDTRLVAKNERRQAEKGPGGEKWGDKKSKPAVAAVAKSSKTGTGTSSSASASASASSSSSSSSSSKGSAIAKLDNSGKFSASWWTQHVKSFGPQLTLAEEGSWWQQDQAPVHVVHAAPAPAAGEKPAAVVRRLEQSQLDSLLRNVEASFADEVAAYQRVRAKTNGSTDQKWMQEMVTSGTLSDKVAALALLVQESPLHELQTLDMLVYMACKPDQRTATLALEAMKDLLVHNLLPDRPLVAFKDRDLAHADWDLRKATVAWYEGELLKRVEKVMGALDVALRGSLAHFKRQALELVLELLSKKPEQERRLLAMLVNKLGDPEGNIAVKALDALRRLLKAHPAMKNVVVREVQQLVSRPSMPARTMYSGVVFLSQIPLDVGEHAVAVQLVAVYVSLFERAVEAKELGSRLLAALLTGINRAFPYLKDVRALSAHTQELFRIAHSASFSSATQALTLLSHLALAEQQPTAGAGAGAGAEAETVQGADEEKAPEQKPSKEMRKLRKAVPTGDAAEPDLVTRFYRALYAKLLSDQVATRARNTAFLNLLYRSIKRDRSDLRSAAFLKRLVMCATHSSAPIAAGLLMLVSEVLQNRPSLTTMMNTVDVSEAEDADQASNSDDDNDNNAAMHRLGTFDGAKREPLYACSAQPSMWEASLLQHHFHPSVKAFSESMLHAPHKITFAGDPTTDFTLTAFLNRFAFKNPKKSVSDKIKRQMPTPEQPLNTAIFADKKYENVAPDKKFFHKFFGQRNKLAKEGKLRDRSARKKGRTGEDDKDDGGDADDNSDLGSDFGEEAIDRFADRLAEGMIDEYAANEGPDMDDMEDGAGSGSDAEGAGDAGSDMSSMESDDGEEKEPAGKNPKSRAAAAAAAGKVGGGKSRKAAEQSSDSDGGSDPDPDAAGSGSDSEDGSGYGGLMVGGGSDDEEEEEEEEGEEEEEEEESEDERTSRKRKAVDAKSSRSKKGKGGSDFAFADAAEYEEQMEAIVKDMGPTGEQKALAGKGKGQGRGRR